MPDASAMRGHAHVQVGQVAIVDARPVVLALADDAHQAVERVLQQVADDPAGAAVDDAGPDDDGPDAAAGASSTSCSCSGRHATSGVGLHGRVLVRGRPGVAEHPHARRVDEARRLARRGAPRRRRQSACRSPADRPSARASNDSSAVCTMRVARLGGRRVRRRLRQLADDRLRRRAATRARPSRDRARARSRRDRRAAARRAPPIRYTPLPPSGRSAWQSRLF